MESEERDVVYFIVQYVFICIVFVVDIYVLFFKDKGINDFFFFGVIIYI